MTPQRLAILTALVGSSIVALGAGFVYPPLGVIVVGVTLLLLAAAAFGGTR